MSISQFPTPFNSSHPSELTTGAGPRPLKVQELKSEYPSNVIKPMMAGNASYGADTTNKIRRFELTYDGLSYTEAKLFDDHRAEAKDTLLGFNFRYQRASASIDELITDVHYDQDGYELDHVQFATSQSRKIRLIKRPT